MSPIALLLPVGLLLAIARVAWPHQASPSGQHLLSFSLPLLARARLHAVPAGGLLTLALVLLTLGAIPWWVLLVVLALLAALIAWPIAYELTTESIRLGHTRPRRWTEFAGVVRAPGGARLQGGAGGRGFRVWLSGSRGDDEFVYLLRQIIKRAYQGRAETGSQPTGEQKAGGDAEAPHTAFAPDSGMRRG